MKTILLIFAIVLLLPLSLIYAEPIPTGNPNECWYQDENGDVTTCVMGGGPVDLDQGLSSSYAIDFLFSWNSIFVFILLISGIIATTLLSIHFILKKKNIRSRPYITIISAVIMLFFGIPSLINGLEIVLLLMQEERLHSFDYVANLTAMASIGFILVLFGMIILLKSKLIRNSLERIK